MEEELAAPSFEMTAGQVRGFLRAYEEQFGTGEAFEAAFYPERIQAQVPVRGRGLAWSGGPGRGSGGRTPRPPR